MLVYTELPTFIYVCVHVHILNPDEREQLSTYVPSLPHQGQFTQGETEEVVEVKIQMDEDGDERRRKRD